MLKILLLFMFFVWDLRAAVPPWGSARQAILVGCAQNLEQNLKKYPSFSFPGSVTELAKLFPNQRVPIFAYGSLLYPQSALKVLPQTVIEAYRLVVAYGYQRTFNYRASLSKKHLNKRDVAMLNLFKTHPFDVVNGVLMWLTCDHLEKLIQREKGYHLVPLIVSDWEQGLNSCVSQPDFWIAYAFIVPFDSSYSHSKINPYPPYAHTARLGAERYGEVFSSFWLETTFLADLVTPFTAWVENSKINCDRGTLCK